MIVSIKYLSRGECVRPIGRRFRLGAWDPYKETRGGGGGIVIGGGGVGG